MTGVRIAADSAEFESISATVISLVDPSVRLPTLPFRAPGGRVAVGEFTRLLGVDFVPVFQALADSHGDTSIAVAVIEPTVSYFNEGFGFFPAFTVATHELDDGYWDGLRFSPSHDPTGEIGESADVLAIAGSSQEWAIWGQRSWDLALVWTVANGPWLDAGVPFADAMTALVDFAGYGTWGTRLSDDEVGEFVRNVEAFG